MTPTQPRTKAGRRAWAKADGLGPKFDTITITAREWRETIVAIEEEAVSEYREALQIAGRRIQLLREGHFDPTGEERDQRHIASLLDRSGETG